MNRYYIEYRVNDYDWDNTHVEANSKDEAKETFILNAARDAMRIGKNVLIYKDGTSLNAFDDDDNEDVLEILNIEEA